MKSKEMILLIFAYCFILIIICFFYYEGLTGLVGGEVNLYVNEVSEIAQSEEISISHRTGTINEKNEKEKEGKQEAPEYFFQIISDLITPKIILNEYLIIEFQVIGTNIPNPCFVNLSYFIKNQNNTIIYEEKEIKILHSNLEFVKSFKFPSNNSYGDYTLFTELNYNDYLTSSETTFSYVAKKNLLNQFKENFIWIIVILFVGILTTHNYFILNNLKKQKKLLKKLLKKIK